MDRLTIFLINYLKNCKNYYYLIHHSNVFYIYIYIYKGSWRPNCFVTLTLIITHATTFNTCVTLVGAL